MQQIPAPADPALEPPAPGRLLLAGTLVLHAFSLWAVGSGIFRMHAPMAVLGGILFLLLTAQLRRNRALVRLWKDPFFYLGLVFLLFLTIQCLNSGRTGRFNPALREIVFSDPPAYWLPSSVKPAEAFEVLSWFIPPIVLALVVRHGLPDIRQLRTLLLGLTVNATVLGIFGTACFLLGVHKLLFIHPMQDHYFASFGYQNFGGEYFMLVTALCMGLFLRAVFHEHDRTARRHQIGISVVGGLVAVLAVHLSVVATSLILTWGLLAVFAAVLAGLAARHFSPAMRLNLVVAVTIASFTVAYSVTGEARRLLEQDFSKLTSTSTLLKEFKTRWWQVETAHRMWQEHPWFGVGGWGYRFMLQRYMPLKPEARRLILAGGKANVHNDTMQYLAEFGGVGVALVTGMIVALAWPLIRYREWNRGLLLFLALGCLLLYLHSMIDLPFRNAPILQLWTMLLAVAGEYARRSSEFEIRNSELRVTR